jgi:hypothetical protein
VEIVMSKRASKLFAFILVSLLGILVFVVFSHIRPVFAKTADLVGRIMLAVVLLTVSLVLRKKERFKPYSRILSAFFIAIVAISLDYYLPTVRLLLDSLNVSIQTPLGIALDKLDSSLIIILSIILLNRLFGEKLSSLYLKKGNLKKGLMIGIIAFIVCVSGSFFVAQLFGAQNLTLARILPWTPYILIFILGNAFNEELLFRGLFLEKVSGITGRFLSNLAISIFFVLHHTGITYTNDALMFLAYLLPLSLAWGYITQDTDSLLGSVLFHAGTDIPVVLVIFSRLP